MDFDSQIQEWLGRLSPISLDEMSGIKLMNRTDTKFVTCKRKLAELLELAQGKYFAQQIDGSRIANYRTVYWDTPEHRFYLDHHNGRAPRQKIRVRTYLDSDKTFLEVKTKNNHGRTKKKRITVPSQERQALHPGADGRHLRRHPAYRPEPVPAHHARQLRQDRAPDHRLQRPFP